ncbi:hypothetical protein D3C77_737440 [compost metagenome]
MQGFFRTLQGKKDDDFIIDRFEYKPGLFPDDDFFGDVLDAVLEHFLAEPMMIIISRVIVGFQNDGHVEIVIEVQVEDTGLKG